MGGAMQTIAVENWEDFEARIQEIRRTIKAGPVLVVSWPGRHVVVT
jgi:hypothetical protein